MAIKVIHRWGRRKFPPREVPVIDPAPPPEPGVHDHDMVRVRSDGSLEFDLHTVASPAHDAEPPEDWLPITTLADPYGFEREVNVRDGRTRLRQSGGPWVYSPPAS